MRFASATTLDADLDALLPVLVERVRDGLDGGNADLAFVFVGAEHAPGVERIQRAILDALGSPRLVGCTAGGVIGGGREYERSPAVSVLAGQLPGAAVHGFHVRTGDLPDPDSPPRAWHESLGVSPTDAPHFVVVPDPWTIQADGLVAGLDYGWPGSVTLGGLASGASKPGEQALLLDDRVLRSGAVGVALMGDVRLEPAVAQGCRPIGPPLTVSACDEHLLTGLDGRAPLEALRETVEATFEGGEGLTGRVLLLGFEMDPFERDDDGPWLVRPLIGVDRKTKGLVVGESLRKGRRVRFHLRDRDTSREDLVRTLEDVEDAPLPAAALLFACTGRGVQLYGRPDHDAAVFADRFDEVPMAGFFCNGEIGPVGGTTHIHGFTSAFGLVRPAVP